MEYFFFENPFLFVKETVMNTIDAGKNFYKNWKEILPAWKRKPENCLP